MKTEACSAYPALGVERTPRPALGGIRFVDPRSPRAQRRGLGSQIIPAYAGNPVCGWRFAAVTTVSTATEH